MKSNGVPETTSTLIYAEKVDNMLKIYKRQKYYDYDDGTTTLIKQYDMTNNSDFKIEVSSIKVSNFRVDYGTDYTDKLVINFKNYYVSATDSISLSKTDINVTKTINEITYLYSDSSNKTNMCYSYGSRKGSWPDKSNCIATITINLKCYAMPNNQSPTITITQPSPNSPFSAVSGYNTINIAGTVTDADSGDILKTYYRIDSTSGTGTQFGSNITANGSAQAIAGTINVSSLSEGVHNIYFWVEDDKGGKSAETSVPIKIDKTAPTVTFGTNGNTTPAKSQSTTVTVTDPTSNGVATSVSTRQYQWTTSSTFPTAGTWTNFSSGATLTQPNGNGDYYLHIKAVDAVGNTRQATSNKFVLDNTAPTVSLTHNHPDLIVRDADTVTITATFNEPMKATPKITIANVGITNVNMTMGANNKIWTYTWDVPSSYNGVAVVTVSGTDLAGNAYSGSDKLTFTVDNIAPTLTISSPSATQVKNGTNVTYTITYDGADTVTLATGNITLNKTGTANGTVTVSGTGTASRTVTISNITGDGTLGISIAAGTASDIAGNTSAAVGPSTTFTVDNTAPTANVPTVTAISNDSIKIEPNAIDPTTGGVAVGLHATPYTLNRDGVDIATNQSGAYTDTGLEVNTAYTYKYKAKDKLNNESNYSTEITRYTLANVPSLSLDSSDQTSISGNIDINGNPSYTETYIERSTASDFSIDIEVVKTWSTDTNFEDTGLQPGKTYYYRVKARNGDNIETAWSDSVSKITIPNTPNAPTVTANDDSTKMNISWTNIEGATEYILYRDGTEIYRGNSTTYEDNELAPNTAYAYTLKAKNESGESPEGSSETKYTRANNPLSIIVTGKTSSTATLDITNDPLNTNIPEIMVEARKKESGEVVGTSPYSTQLTDRLINGLENNVEYEIWAKVKNNDGVENDYYMAIDSVYSNFKPEISLTNHDEDFIISETEGSNTISLTGKAYDKDNEGLVIKATIDTVEKAFNIETAPVTEPDEDNWILTWNAAEIAEGEYTNITITVEDAKGATADVIYTGTIKVDKTLPIATTATIYTDNINTAYADVNDTVTIEFTSSETLKQLPTVKIAGKEATVTDLGSNQYKASYTLTDTDSVGYVKFSIEMVDLAGNKNIVTATTDDSRVFFYNENAYKDIETVEDAIDLLENLPSPATQDKRDEIAENIVDKVITLPELTVDDILDVIDAIPREPAENAVSDEKANELIEKLIEKAIELAEDNEDLEKIKEVIEDSTLPDEVKDRLIDEITDRENLNNVDIDDSQVPPIINLDPLTPGREYRIEITDVETDEIVRNIKTLGGTPIDVPELLEGKTYKIKIDIVKIDDETVIATRTFIITVRDITKPEIKAIYTLDGKLYVKAEDNVKLHDQAYAFRVIQDGENVEEIESSIITITSMEFNVSAFTTSGNSVTSISFQEDNNISIIPKKTVITIVRDAAENINYHTVNVTKNNEILFGETEIPEDIKRRIEEANRPPITDRKESDYKDNDYKNDKEKQSDIVIVTPISPEVVKEIEGVLEKDKVIIKPIETEVNSGRGEIEIDLRKDLDILNALVKSQLGDNKVVTYRVNVTEKATKRLVYTRNIYAADKIVIPNLLDSTVYIVQVAVVIDGQPLAFKDVEAETYDRTAPVIEQVKIKNGTLSVYATDNIKLHEKAYQYSVNNVIRLGASDNYKILVASVASDTANWSIDTWTENAQIKDLDNGAKVRIIVRDHAENYTVVDTIIEEDKEINTINSNEPMTIKNGEVIEVNDLIDKIIREHNNKNPEDKIKFTGNYNDYELKTSDPNIAYIENGKLIAKQDGKLVITLTDKKTGKSYLYSIIVSKYLNFDRRIIIQTQSETNLNIVFEKALYKEFRDREITYILDSDNAKIHSGSILKAGDKESIETIIATDGQKELPLYAVIIEDEYPVSDVEIIVTNLSYVIKKGDTINIKDISVFYNELMEETDTKYLVAETGTGNLEVENGIIKAVEEGKGIINIIDLVKSRVEQIEFLVTDFESKEVDVLDETDHWAKDAAKKAAEKGILPIEVKEDLNKKLTIGEFFEMLSKIKVYNRDTNIVGRNKLPLNIENNEKYYYTMEALQKFTMFEVEDLFGRNIDMNKNITREEVAYILAVELGLTPGKEYQYKDTRNSRFIKQINAVRQENIMIGINNEYFAPNKHLTIAEMAKILENIEKNNKVSFTRKN